MGLWVDVSVLSLMGVWVGEWDEGFYALNCSEGSPIIYEKSHCQVQPCSDAWI